MAMVKLIISVPKRIKVKLHALRKEGTSASGFIRSLLEKEFQASKGNTLVKGSCLCRAELRKSENSGGSGEGGPDYRRKDSSVESGAGASTFPNQWS